MMNEKSRQYSPAEISSIFAMLEPRDVEQFYRSYHLWDLYRQIAELQGQITTLHERMAENNEQMQEVHPSAIALATLARLQSNGVNDIDLLDRLLARGEAWLDQTMQRLAYCEQFDFIRNNYTEWCENALDGAYDWIDSMQKADVSSLDEETAHVTNSSVDIDDPLSEATEELLLQKLMSEEDEALMLAPTLKRSVVSSGIVEHPPAADVAEIALEEIFPIETDDDLETALELKDQATRSEQEVKEQSPAEEAQDNLPAPPVAPPLPEDKPRRWEIAASSSQKTTPQGKWQTSQSARPRHKRSFLLRLLTAFFGK